MKTEDLDYELICNAVKGRPDAVERILQHYDHYINALCAYESLDEKGVVRKRLDPDMKVQVQFKLIEAIKKWRELP